MNSVNSSFFLFHFSSLSLPIAVALPFTPFDEDPTSYNAFWEVVEEVFCLFRSDLSSFSRIDKQDFDYRLIKLDFRVK